MFLMNLMCQKHLMYHLHLQQSQKFLMNQMTLNLLNYLKFPKLPM
jgi:hypothetical protein